MLKCPPLALIMHGNICNTHQVHGRRRWTEAASDDDLAWLGTQFVDDAMYEWHNRLWACVHVKGGHL